ncbi:MAG: hypothetical protein ABSA92_03040 [Candidatus Bathyarchaeia archaeon]
MALESAVVALEPAVVVVPAGGSAGRLAIASGDTLGSSFNLP